MTQEPRGPAAASGLSGSPASRRQCFLSCLTQARVVLSGNGCPLAPGLCLDRAPRRCVACVTQACALACGSPAHPGARCTLMFAPADSPEDAFPSRQRVAAAVTYTDNAKLVSGGADWRSGRRRCRQEGGGRALSQAQDTPLRRQVRTRSCGQLHPSHTRRCPSSARPPLCISASALAPEN